MGKTFSFVSGALFGAAAGAIVGVALAPRSGAETRAMAADIANDAWDNMRDTYEQMCIRDRPCFTRLPSTFTDSFSPPWRLSTLSSTASRSPAS